MDLNTHFLENYSQHFVASRREAASTVHFGNGSPVTGMIATVAAGVRRAAATIERWARGGNTEVADFRLPRVNSAR